MGPRRGSDIIKPLHNGHYSTVRRRALLRHIILDRTSTTSVYNAFKCLVCPGLHKNYYYGYCQVSIIRKDNFVFSMHEYTDNRIPLLIKRNTNKRLYCKGKETLSAWPRKLSNSEYYCGGKVVSISGTGTHIHSTSTSKW